MDTPATLVKLVYPRPSDISAAATELQALLTVKREELAAQRVEYATNVKSESYSDQVNVF